MIIETVLQKVNKWNFIKTPETKEKKKIQNFSD